MNKLALPEDDINAYIGKCDDCEVKDSDMCRGNGIYYEEYCYSCTSKRRMMEP